MNNNDTGRHERAMCALPDRRGAAVASSPPRAAEIAIGEVAPTSSAGVLQTR